MIKSLLGNMKSIYLLIFVLVMFSLLTGFKFEEGIVNVYVGNPNNNLYDSPIQEHFVSINTETLSKDTSNWSVRNIDLSPLSRTNIYIAWRHHDSYDMNLIDLDGIVLFSSGRIIPDHDFPPPSELTYIIEEGNNVVLNWQEPVFGVRDLNEEVNYPPSFSLFPPHKGKNIEASTNLNFSSQNPLTGYIVFRDDIEISDVISDTYFTDIVLEIGVYLYSVVAVYLYGSSDPVFIEVEITSSIHTDSGDIIATKLNENFPNPFNQSTTITFELATETSVKIDVYNNRGQWIQTLINEILYEGPHFVEWNGTDNFGRNVSSGVYFYQMQANDFLYTRSMLLLN